MLKRKKQFRKNITCEACNECVYIESGDMMCTAKEEPLLVYEDFCPTENYLWCNGKAFENI